MRVLTTGFINDVATSVLIFHRFDTLLPLRLYDVKVDSCNFLAVNPDHKVSREVVSVDLHLPVDLNMRSPHEP